MSKFWIKIFALIYDLTSMFLGVTAPFAMAMLIYQCIKPTNYIVGILFVIIWIISCWCIVALGFYLLKKIRYHFEIIDEYFEIIEDYRDKRNR